VFGMQNSVNSASRDFFVGLECGTVSHGLSIVPQPSVIWSVLLKPSRSDNVPQGEESSVSTRRRLVARGFVGALLTVAAGKG
jgi:hypothetical protein